VNNFRRIIQNQSYQIIKRTALVLGALIFSLAAWGNASSPKKVTQLFDQIQSQREQIENFLDTHFQAELLGSHIQNKDRYQLTVEESEENYFENSNKNDYLRSGKKHSWKRTTYSKSEDSTIFVAYLVDEKWIHNLYNTVINYQDNVRYSFCFSQALNFAYSLSLQSNVLSFETLQEFSNLVEEYKSNLSLAYKELTNLALNEEYKGRANSLAFFHQTLKEHKSFIKTTPILLVSLQTSINNLLEYQCYDQRIHSNDEKHLMKKIFPSQQVRNTTLNLLN